LPENPLNGLATSDFYVRDRRAANPVPDNTSLRGESFRRSRDLARLIETRPTRYAVVE
jgi:hypothetical protein